MRVLIVFNPISGAGRAESAAAALAEALRAAAHQARIMPTHLGPSRLWLDEALQDVDLLVIAGGDGAMRLLAPAACRSNTPVYHLPLGTENLFAREFGMDRAPATLLRAIALKEVRRVDVGVANGRWFLLMASVGFDADVVHELARRRGGAIRHSTYIKPILATMRSWRPPRLTIEVDGEEIVHGQPGIAVIANSRQYGWRIDPASPADMTDGLLDAVFLPTRGLADVLQWAVRSRMRRQFRGGRARHVRGRHVVVRCDHSLRYQLDGDPPGMPHELLPAGMVADAPEAQEHAPLRLSLNVCPAQLPVLMAHAAGRHAAGSTQVGSPSGR